MTTISESDLIHHLKLKNEKAYVYLYDAYSAALFSLIKRMVRRHLPAEEILQNVFLKIWLNIDRYSTEKSSLYTWMFSIARNESIDYLRSKQVKEIALTSSFSEIQTTESTLTEKRMVQFDLLKSLSGLPHKERVIIDLYTIGFTCKEIGQILCLPEGSVKTKMRTSYRKLKMILS